MTQNKENSQSNTSKLAIAGLVASAAAGVIYLYGKNGQKRRQRLRGWMMKMKGDIMDRIAQAGELTEDKYKEIIDEVSERYANQKHVRHDDIERIQNQLKDHWSDLKQAVNEHVAYVKDKREGIPDSEITEAIAEAVRDIASSRGIDENQDIPDLLEEIISSGVDTAIDELEDGSSEDGDRSETVKPEL